MSDDASEFPPAYEWDPDKNRRNVARRRLSFREASTALEDAASATDVDSWDSEDESRDVTIGRTNTGRIVVVAHTDRGARIRIISARPAEPQERKDYEAQARRRGF